MNQQYNNSIIKVKPKQLAKVGPLIPTTDRFVTPQEMGEILEALMPSNQQTGGLPGSHLEQISFPELMGSWTKELRVNLSSILKNKIHSLKRVKFSFQALPATSSLRQDGCGSIVTATKDDRCELWSIWKEFIASSQVLQELDLSNLSDQELTELIAILQTKHSTLSILTLNGRGITLKSLTALVYKLERYRTRCFLNYALFIGEEYNAKLVSELAKAMMHNYSVEELTVSCSDYTVYAFEDLKRVYPDYGIAVDAILALNQAGRRYVLDDYNNSSKALKVLSSGQVNNDLNAIYLHLIDHPSLCAIPQSDRKKSAQSSPSCECMCGAIQRKCDNECFPATLYSHLYL
jgi:hypothetical protein